MDRRTLLASAIAAPVSAGWTCALAQARAPALFPAHQASGVNPDVKLKIRFAAPPVVGTTGQVRIYDASNDRLVDTLDLSIPAGPTDRVDPNVRARNYIDRPYDYARSGPRKTNANTRAGTGSSGAVDTQGGETYQLTIIGGFTDGFHFYPITVNGDEATIHPHHDLLEYGKTYYVQIDPGVLDIPGHSFTGIAGKDWTFSTKTAAHAPAPDTRRLVVSADGRGDFNTVQGALDFVPDHAGERITIIVRPGVYEEIIYCRNKANITLKGESPDTTILRYANNEVFNPHPANYRTNEWPGTFPSRRAAVAIDNCNDFNISGLTLQTTEPGQSEGLLITGERNILRDVVVIGGGDALQANGRIYMADSFVDGTGDTILGRGACYFERTTFRSTRVFMWIRNTDANHGNIFRDCTFIGTAEPTDLARAPTNGASTYPYAEAVFLNCYMHNISPEGFGGAHDGDNVHFWELNSMNLDGSPLDVSQRAPWSRRLDPVRDAELIANYSNPAWVLGGWDPLV